MVADFMVVHRNDTTGKLIVSGSKKVGKRGTPFATIKEMLLCISIRLNIARKTWKFVDDKIANLGGEKPSIPYGKIYDSRTWRRRYDPQRRYDP
jgi:hypothetical protein